MSFSHKHFRNTETKQLEDYVNELQCYAKDITSAISGNDFHVFARRANNSAGRWSHVTGKWSTQMIASLETHFHEGTAVFLGLSGNDSHYLLWDAD